MPYHCIDCSYHGSKCGQLGECPACGSRNIVQRTFVASKKSKPAVWRLVVLLILWATFITVLIRKLTS